MATLLWLAVAVPAVAALAARFTRGAVGAVAVAGAAAALVPSVLLLSDAAAGRQASSAFVWLPAGDLDVGLRLDGLSAAMSVTVAAIGLVIVVYSAGYFSGDPRRRSALAGMLGFLAAMQGLVLAGDYLTLLVFWELVGAASARLIAYSRDDPDAAPAAVRAFLTTRAADLGLYVAVFALFTSTGSLSFTAERPDGAFGALVGLGLVVAAMGKSAQVPLQGWLSAAMAGPTPVSALLHSATMVAAGVYLLMRSYDLLAGWPLEIAGWVGAVTAVAGATIALAQHDLKRVLAGSTTSQLGLMFVGVAAGGPAVALFQLITHAAGKAGMFLAAGVFQHNRHSTSLDRLRGAGRDDRAAFAGFAIGALSVAAVPPLAVFWSKEHITAAAEMQNSIWFLLVLVAAAGSAAYLLRPALILWDGSPAAAAVARAGRHLMLGGVGAMAAASVVLGAIGDPLVNLLDAPGLPRSGTALAASLGAVALGAFGVIASPAVPAGLAAAARHQLYANELLDRLVVRPALRLAAVSATADRRYVDHAVDAVGRGALVSARSANWVEVHAIDAAVDGLARLIGRGGDDLRRLQSGRLFEYLRGAVLGAIAVSFLIALSALT